MTHHYAYADLVWCQGKLMFAEDITGKEGKIGLLEENAGLIENPLFDDVSAGIYYVGYSEVKPLQDRISEPDVLRTFFRMEIDPWHLVRLERYPFADDGGTFELSEQDVERLLDKIPGADHVRLETWRKEFLTRGHVYCPDTDPAGFSLAFLWQCLKNVLREYDPQKDELTSAAELWEDYRYSRHRPADGMRLPARYRWDMLQRILHAADMHTVHEESARAYHRLLDELVNENDQRAVEHKAEAFFRGNALTEPDLSTAEELLLKLYAEGRKDKALDLGILYKTGIEEPDIEKAEAYLKEAVRLGISEACLELADLYRESDPEESLRLLKEAESKMTRSGALYAETEELLGRYTEEGTGTAADRGAAEAYYAEAVRALRHIKASEAPEVRARLYADVLRSGTKLDDDLMELIEPRRVIRVAAAVIIENGRVLATQRGYGAAKDGWEFPGGKIEAGETGGEAIVREIREELDMTIEPEKLITVIEYDYPAFHLSMECWLARITAGTPVLKEHEAARWLSYEQLDSVDWLGADRTILDLVREELV